MLLLRPPGIPTEPMLDPWHNYGTYAMPFGILKEPRPDPLAYLWNLCCAPQHTYGTYATPLGIAMEPMSYPIVQGKKESWDSL